jgi:hypothetical protein
MAIATYSDLQTAIEGWLFNRDDLAAVIPDFIALAEADLNTRVRHWRMEKRVVAEIDTQYSAIPADFLEPIRFYLTANRTSPIELIGQMEMLNIRANTSNTLGRPQYYAITAGEIEVVPTPDAAYEAELYYYSTIPPLSASNTTNWLLTHFPNAYLYGALVHAAPYLEEDARLQIWASLYSEAINAINKESEDTKIGSAGRRIKIRAY